MSHLDSLFVAKDTILHNVGCTALACGDDIMPLRHSASLAMMSRPVDAKLRHIAATRTQTRFLNHFFACHGWQTARCHAEKWNQAFCLAHSVFTPKRGAGTLSERAIRQRNSCMNDFLFCTPRRRSCRAEWREFVFLGATADALRLYRIRDT
jgi:hypothetical protein